MSLYLIFFGVLMVGSAVAGSYFFGAHRDGVTVEGVVVDVEAKPPVGRDDSWTYKSVVDFVEQETGETFTVTGQGSSSTKPTIGDSRQVSYSPGNPEGARVLENGWLIWLFAGLGVGISLLGVALSWPEIAALFGRGKVEPSDQVRPDNVTAAVDDGDGNSRYRYTKTWTLGKKGDKD